ncbi:hypothetical protein H8356DRAFT_1271939 [Neocallimastix lanati (nom. inval.)]|nr:hypothetical protein H8356DRAFT_1271939 [Neocallimastix sp. JGI-2020a]
MNFYNQKIMQDIQNMQNMQGNPQLQLQLQMQNPQNPQFLQLQQQQQIQFQLQQQQQLQQLQQQQLQQQQHLKLQLQQQQKIMQMHQLQLAKLNNTMPFANTTLPTAINNSQFKKSEMNTPAFNEKRNSNLQEIVKCLTVNSQVDREKATEVARSFEDKIFKSSDSAEKYEKLFNSQLNIIKQKTLKTNIQQPVKVQQPATITTQNITPQFPATMIANKVNGNAVLLQNNNPNAAALSKTINNASPSMNTAKIASISPSIQNISQITQPVALNNTLVKTASPNNMAQNLQFQQQNQNIVLQQKQAALHNQAQTTAQAKKPATVAQPHQPVSLTSEQQKQRLAKIKELYDLSLKFRDLMKYINIKDKDMKGKMDIMVRTYKYAQMIYEKREETSNIPMEALEKLEKNMKIFCEVIEKNNQNNAAAYANAAANSTALNNSGSPNVAVSAASNIAQTQSQQLLLQLQRKAQAQNQNNLTGSNKIIINQNNQPAATAGTTLLNNSTQIKTEPVKVETVSKAPINQLKSVKNEIKQENNKNGVLTSNSEVISSEENEKASNKTSNSTSTKKRNSKKSTTPSSSVSSINLNSKKTETSSATDISSKKGANASKDIKVEKDNGAFLGKIDRNINIFLLENKTFKNHVKSNSKTKNIVQNSFKYIIDPNRPAYGINSCAEEISSLCMSNENKNKDKPIKLENINDSLNGIYNNNNNNIF